MIAGSAWEQPALFSGSTAPTMLRAEGIVRDTKAKPPVFDHPSGALL
jgi:hypothetical protein